MRTYGSSPFKIAVIHGGPGAVGDAAGVAKRLGETFGVLEPLETAHSVEGQIEELAAVLRENAALPAILIGHSWGAWLSLLTAARFPELAAKLILIGCPALTNMWAAQLTPARLSRLRGEERAEYLASPPVKRMVELSIKADTYASLESSEPDLGEFDLEMFQSVWAEAAALRSSGALVEQALRVGCPVVAMHGDYDPSPVGGVLEPLSALPNFRMKILERCGHTPWRERFAVEAFYSTLTAEIAL